MSLSSCPVASPVDQRAYADAGSRARSAESGGVAFALAAYFLWGFQPVYFKAVAHVPAAEVLAHRIVWSWVLLVVLLCGRERRRSIVEALSSRRTLATLAGSTFLIGTSWYAFIWAVAHGFVLQASLAYFMCPLLTVALGFVFLRERLRRWQVAGVLLAAAGVTYLAIAHGQVPILALILAGSFGVYGLLRKIAAVDPIGGVMIELTVLLPAALIYLVYLAICGRSTFGASSLRFDGLLALAGVFTAVPQASFVIAARRLRLATLGVLQYITPSMHFLLAVAVYGEVFTRTHLITFACIWVALVIYSVDSIRASRGRYGTGPAARTGLPLTGAPATSGDDGR